MSTELQKNLAKEIVANTKRKKPKNKAELLDSVGYAKSVQETKPGEILNQIGVQEALEELGFTEYNAKKVVQEIMLNPYEDAGDRLKATDQVFKVKGSYKDSQENGKTLIVVISGESASRYNVKPNELQGETN